MAVEDLSRLDWSKIDISEWIGLLQVTNNYPTIDKSTLDKLTGKGTALSIGGDRENTLIRNQSRLEDKDFSGTRKEAEDKVRKNLN